MLWSDTKTAGRNTPYDHRCALFLCGCAFDVRFACRDSLLLRGVHACAMGRPCNFAHNTQRGHRVYPSDTHSQYRWRELQGDRGWNEIGVSIAFCADRVEAPCFQEICACRERVLVTFVQVSLRGARRRLLLGSLPLIFRVYRQFKTYSDSSAIPLLISRGLAVSSYIRCRVERTAAANCIVGFAYIFYNLILDMSENGRELSIYLFAHYVTEAQLLLLLRIADPVLCVKQHSPSTSRRKQVAEYAGSLVLVQEMELPAEVRFPTGRRKNAAVLKIGVTESK